MSKLQTSRALNYTTTYIAKEVVKQLCVRSLRAVATHVSRALVG